MKLESKSTDDSLLFLPIKNLLNYSSNETISSQIDGSKIESLINLNLIPVYKKGEGRLCTIERFVVISRFLQ